MKKTIIILLAFFSFTLSSYAQQWTEVYSNDNVVIEMQKMDCNTNNRVVPYTYAILKISNKTNQEFDFSFNMNLWYNNVKLDQTPRDAGDFAELKTIHLMPNQVVEGDCDLITGCGVL